MITRHTFPLVPLFLGLLLGQDALAFYNPSTGRWLSRDPVNDKGSGLVRATQDPTGAGRRRMLLTGRPGYDADASKVRSTRTRQDSNLSGFCGNDPVARTDSLGLQDRTAAELAGYCQDPCGEYATEQRRDNEGWSLDGAPICCGGKLYFCAWGHERLKNWRASELVKECIEEHERTHKDHVQPCALCDWSATKPEFRTDVNKNTAECEAYRAGVACLSLALPRCGGDPDCEDEILEVLRAKQGYADYYCSRAPKPGGG